jgi:hypothetical protein
MHFWIARHQNTARQPEQAPQLVQASSVTGQASGQDLTLESNFLKAGGI